MGIFSSIFGSSEKKEQKQIPFIMLNDSKQLEEITEKSKQKVQVIFKHSTACGISSMVLNRFIERYNFTPEQIDLYYLDILSYRTLSNEIGYTFGVFHQSPQLIVIKNEEVLKEASHTGINLVYLEEFV